MFLKSKNSTDHTDAELILQYKKRNDPDVLGQLYSRYVVLVYGLCLKYLKNREVAKDAVMQIFELLSVELHRHDVRNFKSWLYVFSKNHCLMEIRKQTSLRKKEISWLENEGKFMEYAEEIHLIDGETDKDINDALQDCISRLKEEQRQCLQLFYYEDKSYREIVGATKLEEKKVKSLLQNGKRNLKICLENKHVR